MTEQVADNAPAAVEAQASPATDNAPAPTTSAENANPQQQQQTQEQGDSAFAVPEAYKDAGWADKVKSIDDLWKSHAAAQELIGRKKIVPDPETASEQEINDYYGALRPQDHTAYDLGEGMSEENREVYGKMLHESGLSKYQADKLIKQYTEHEQSLLADSVSEEGFKQEMEKSFGADHEKVVGKANALAKEHLSAEDQQVLENMPNKVLGLIYRLTNNVSKSYGMNEGAHAAGGGGAAPKVDVNKQRADIRAEIREMDGRIHTAAEKKKLTDMLAATYKQ